MLRWLTRGFARQGGVLRGNLRSSTGHLKAGRLPRRRAVDEEDEDEDDFDQLARELAADARASRVSDRLRTPDEIAAEKAAQLADLERRRLKRMRSRGSDDEASSGEEEDAKAGGYAARRAKRAKPDRSAKPRVETVSVAPCPPLPACLIYSHAPP